MGQKRLQNQILDYLANMSFAKEKGRIGILNQKSMLICSIHELDLHDLKDCAAFKHWTNETKHEYLKRKGIC